MLGLGVGAGFIGGVALGAASTSASYGVYHRYNRYRDLMYQRRSYGGIYAHDYDYGYYNNYYHNSHCFGGCPWHSHCRWGFCECNYG